MKNKLLIILSGFAVIAIIFRGWFVNAQIIGGDWIFLYKETLNGFPFMPTFWSGMQSNGLGGQILSYSLDSYLYLIDAIFADVLHIPWEIVYKIFFFGLFLFFSSFSSIYLLKTCFKNIKNWQLLIGCIVYLTNTYILMVVGGGQMGVSLAYSLFPLALARFIILFNKPKLKNSIIAGIVFELLFLFDARIAYIDAIIIALYFLFSLQKIYLKNVSNFIKLVLFGLIIPGSIIVILASFWAMPLLLSRSPLPYEAAVMVNSAGLFKFFSFADFSHTLSLLHSNWPENIFGKAYFMQPEFLILPLLAFSSLFLINNKKNFQEKLTIIFFSLVGLMGAFLAKGANGPFGEINVWLYGNFPGFTMFRDPTKFYFLISLAYSVLIPFALGNILNKFGKIKLSGILPIVFIIFWLMTIRQAVLGQLGGTFEFHSVPQEYFVLKDKLFGQKDYFRTLWVPRQQRFTYYSELHPAIEAGPLFGTSDLAKLMGNIKKSSTEKLVSELGVKYIVVPYDSLAEFFLKDRKYDKTQSEYLARELEKIKWLKKVNGFGKIAVFENLNYRDHFWTTSENLSLEYRFINPTKYEVEVRNAKAGDVFIFSEKYNQNWLAKVNGYEELESKQFNKLFNSFVLEKDGNYTLSVYYGPQKWADIGFWISGIAAIGIFSFIGFGYLNKKW